MWACKEENRKGLRHSPRSLLKLLILYLLTILISSIIIVTIIVTI